ncbi:MAG: hypothetical protein RRC34_08875 [Lentisphaeria bacterium]|nr:hypothetical protein [Lentisphaeria bacterium]
MPNDFDSAAPKPYGPVPSARQSRWHRREFYGFLHFTWIKYDNHQ